MHINIQPMCGISFCDLMLRSAHQALGKSWWLPSQPYQRSLLASPLVLIILDAIPPSFAGFKIHASYLWKPASFHQWWYPKMDGKHAVQTLKYIGGFQWESPIQNSWFPRENPIQNGWFSNGKSHSKWMVSNGKSHSKLLVSNGKYHTKWMVSNGKSHSKWLVFQWKIPFKMVGSKWLVNPIQNGWFLMEHLIQVKIPFKMDGFQWKIPFKMVGFQ